MFCTLEEAATRLKATETDLEALLREGSLQEFRDGSARFLKVADVDALMNGQTGGVALKAPPEVRPPASRPAPTESAKDEIRLPPYAAVRVKTRYRQARRASLPPEPQTGPPPAPRDSQPKRQPVAQVRPRPGVHLPAPTPSFTPRRPKPQTRDLSLKEWIWAGLLDDRPGTLIFLLLAVLIGVSGITGAVYLLTQLL
jgi:hypothetical protein